MIKKFFNHKAQTVTELAVFGSILIFMIGAIVKQNLSSSYYQNHSYKVMRQALLSSYLHSLGTKGANLDDQGNSSRNSANVLLIEDRLSVRSAQHASVDRAPQMAQASGTFSRNLMMPVGVEHPLAWEYQLPIFDVYINGQHFPFSVAGLRRVCLTPQENDSVCSLTEVIGQLQNVGPMAYALLTVWPPPNNEMFFYMSQEWPSGVVGERWTEGCAYNKQYPDLKLNCATLYGQVSGAVLNDNWCYTEYGGEVPPGPEVAETCPACVPSNPNNMAPFWEAPGGGDCNLGEDDRFDLKRDGSVIVEEGDRLTFGWQWIIHRAFSNEEDDRTVSTRGVPGIAKGDALDFDKDEKVESIVEMYVVPKEMPYLGFGAVRPLSAGIVFAADIMDYQEGDIDFSYDSQDDNIRPGLDDKLNMYTQVKNNDSDGNTTFYRIEEGKLYDGDQYVRSTQRKDQVDIIERRFQLTKDTGRFCTNGIANVHVGNKVVCGYYKDNDGNWTTNGPSDCTSNPFNPVEACCSTSGCCSGGANMEKTCMELTEHPVIWVRSRIENKQGRKWVTDISADDYIDF